jgi:hypothetical protein
MPLSQNDDTIALVDLNDPTNQVAFASGSAVTTGSLGFIALGVTPGGSSSFLQLDSSGLMRITGSVATSGVGTITGSISVFNTVSTLGSSEGITGSAPPSRFTFAGGFDSSSGFGRAFSVDTTGRLNVNATFAPSNTAGTGSTAPTTASLDGGVDGSGILRPLLVDSSGRLLVQVFNSASITGSVGISGTPTITGSVTVPNTVTVTGSVGLSQIATVTGSITIGSPVVSSINAVRVFDPHPDSTSTATLGALNAAVTIDMSGSVGCGFQLATGTLVGTLTPEISFDGGTTWVTTGFFDVDTKGISDTITVSSTTATKSILLPAGTGLVRVRVSAYTSGTSSGTLRATFAPPQVIYNAPIDGRRNTYAGATAAFASAATATDIFVIYGSATKTIRVLRIQVYATQTTAGAASIFLIKRSTAPTGGTSVATTKVPLDSTSAAATATVQHYTANPTVGTTVGNVQAYRGIIPAAASLINNPICTWDFGNRPGQAIVLRGTGEGVAVNLNGVTVTGGSFIINCEWTEE